MKCIRGKIQTRDNLTPKCSYECAVNHRCDIDIVVEMWEELVQTSTKRPCHICDKSPCELL